MMRKNLDAQKMLSLNLFATLLFVFALIFTFDTYSLNQVTPELILMNLFGKPFARMELVAILFAITFALGAGISVLLKNKSKNILSLSSGMIGVITMVIAVLDVDLLQSICPTMRISHVIMTLSRLSAFAIGATGLFVGFNLAVIAKYATKIGTKTAYMALITAFIASVLSVAENLYFVVYLLIAVLLFAVAIASQYTNKSLEEIPQQCKLDLLFNANSFFVTLGGTFAILTINLYMIFTLQFNSYACFAVLVLMIVAYLFAKSVKICGLAKYIVLGVCVAATIVSAFVQIDFIFILSSCLIAFAFGTLRGNERHCSIGIVISSCGAIIATVLAYTFNHYVSNVTTFSSNRVVYSIKSWFFLLIMGAMIVSIILQVVPNIIIKCKNNKQLKNNFVENEENSNEDNKTIENK